MNPGTLRMTGIAGLVWGVAAILVFLVLIVVGVGAFTSAAQGTDAADAARRAAASVGVLPKIVSAIGYLALIWALFQLSQVLGGMGAMACYGTIVISLVLIVLNFVQVTVGFLPLILTVLHGIGLLLVGVFALMSKPVDSGSFKGFAILMIILGATTALVFTAFLYPFLALATGILLFVAMNGAAKAAA